MIGCILKLKNKTMKFRNNWRIHNKQWDKLQLKLRLGKIDVFVFEADITSKFYMITIFNFSIKTK
jgi:hypothetical protein